jgi:hypothetical protein
MPELTKEFFTVEHEILYDIDISFTRESWNGRIKACRGIGASSLSEEEVLEFEKEHMEALNGLAEEFTIPHYVTLLDLKKKKR